MSTASFATSRPTGDGGDAPQTEVEVAFSADGNRTLVTFRQSPFDSAESRDSHLEGWRECLDRLGEGLQEAGR